MVKSLGDGMLLEFPHVQPAVASAFAIQRMCADANVDVPSGRQMLLRIGGHVGELISDAHDVYGRGVNLAARLTTLAGPGEIVVSSAVRDELTLAVDADIEDLGDCYLKHVQQPVRAYRVGPPGVRPVIEPGRAASPELRPTIAVIPFDARASQPEHQVLGEVLADEIIATLSRTADMHVISRLSTTVFRGRTASLAEVAAHLHANYVLSGAYQVSGDTLKLTVELAEVKSGHVALARQFSGRVSGILAGTDEVIGGIVADVSGAILSRELDRAQSLALPTLESYTLLMGAIVLMHRGSWHDFEAAQRMLQTLIDRAPRQAISHAWLAKWYVLRFNRGRSSDQKSEATLALDCTKRALDADPHCSLALAIDGFVHTNLLKQLDVAQQRYELALEVNPNDSLAWLLKGTLHAFKGEGDSAVRGTTQALRLSPLDPLRYFYESLAATAALSAGEYERAIDLAERSLRINRLHTSTLRALAIGQACIGRLDLARETVRDLLTLEPTLTIQKFLERSPSGPYRTGTEWSAALRMAGVPG